MKVTIASVILLKGLVDASLDRGVVVQSILRQGMQHKHDRNLAINDPRRKFSLMEPLEDLEIDEHQRERRNVDNKQQACDSGFLACLGNDKCLECFASLQVEDVDWASVTPDLPCLDVVKFLQDGGHCKMMEGDATATNIFCDTFSNCVVWDDVDPAGGGGGSDGGATNSTTLDCSELTECYWEGIKTSFLGDGVCHDNVEGCYNTEVCGYDAGDCCEDTCTSPSPYIECGSDGFSCRDPLSDKCDTMLTTKCENASPDMPDVEPDIPDCNSDQNLYRLVEYDSFGDGWDDTSLILTAKNDPNNVIFKGGLTWGAQGTEYMCLSAAPLCYNVKLNGGTWGNEISWELKPPGEGMLAVASGGSPMDCNFPVAGATDCENTCTGRGNVSPSDDPEYKTYKELYQCIEKKCLIQVGACEADAACSPCFTEDAPSSCFANDNFNAVINCGLCQCGEKENAAFCEQKEKPGQFIPPDATPEEPAKPRTCSAAETLNGSNAVIKFSQCTDFDEVGMMVSEFDSNNFGALDQFEACAHGYTQEEAHGGRTALGCMRILHNAMDQPPPPESTAPAEAIQALASLIYTEAESFCECAKTANEEAPLCPGFQRFKTLLYESLDACKSLDEIDCAAWTEFSDPCKVNVETEFGSSDFTSRTDDKCKYVQDGCGGIGDFPAFRRIDCGSEVSKASWDFYTLFSRSCLGEEPKDSTPQPTPGTVPTAPTPVAPSTPVTPDSTPQPVAPSVTTPEPTQVYIPPDEPSGSPTKKKKKTMRNFFVFSLFAGAAFFFWKKRNEGFSFVRYRQPRNFGGNSGMMGGSDSLYSGLAMGDSGATSFEPPTLPPPPSQMGAPAQQQFI